MLQREVPIWLAVVLVIVVVLVVIGIYWLRMPRAREGAAPPPGAPIQEIPGPALGGSEKLPMPSPGQSR